MMGAPHDECIRPNSSVAERGTGARPLYAHPPCLPQHVGVLVRLLLRGWVLTDDLDQGGVTGQAHSLGLE